MQSLRQRTKLRGGGAIVAPCVTLLSRLLEARPGSPGCGDTMSNQNGGGFGCDGLGPKARAVSRWGRVTLDAVSCRIYSLFPTSLYCGLVREARKATRSSISDSVSAKGWMSSSSHGSVTPSPLL